LTCCCNRVLVILDLLLLTARSLGREEAVIQPGLKACWLLSCLGLPHPVQYPLRAHTQPSSPSAHMYTQHFLRSASIPSFVTHSLLCAQQPAAARHWKERKEQKRLRPWRQVNEKPSVILGCPGSKTLPGLCVVLNSRLADSCAVNSEKVESDLGRLLIIFDLTPLHMHLCHSVALLAEVCTGDDIRIPASYSSQTLVSLFCVQNITSMGTTRISHCRCCDGSCADKPRSRRLKLS